MSGTRALTQKEDRQTTLWSIAIVLVISAVIIIASTWIHSQRISLMETFTTTSDGTVARVETRRKKSGRRRVTEYTYYVSFLDSDKREHTTKSMATTERRQIHDEGDEVRVRYDPMKADDACVIEGDEKYV